MTSKRSFGDGEKWLQGCGCDNEGRRCLSAALYGVKPAEDGWYFATMAAIQRAIADLYYPECIVGFNDNLAHSYDDVRRVLHRAREMATLE